MSWQKSAGGPGAYAYAKQQRKNGVALATLKADRAFAAAYTREKRARGLGGGYETLFKDQAAHLYARPAGSSKLYYLPPGEISHPKTSGMTKYASVPYAAANAAYAKSMEKKRTKSAAKSALAKKRPRDAQGRFI